LNSEKISSGVEGNRVFVFSVTTFELDDLSRTVSPSTSWLAASVSRFSPWARADRSMFTWFGN